MDSGGGALKTYVFCDNRQREGKNLQGHMAVDGAIKLLCTPCRERKERTGCDFLL